MKLLISISTSSKVRKTSKTVNCFAVRACILFSILFCVPASPAQQLFRFDTSGNLQQTYSTNTVAPPQIAQQTRFLITESNGTVSISVVSSALSGALTYQWFFTGAALAGQTNDTLFLSGIQTDQLGAYQVVLSGMGGSVTSAVFNVDFDNDPDALLIPKSVLFASMHDRLT